VRIKFRDSQALPIHVMLQHLGRKIVRGSRRSVGPFYLAGMVPGAIKEVALPPFYARYVNRVWQPFIDRDWPYFRHLRIQRLKVLSRYRMLTDTERDELDTFSADELRDLTTADRSEIEEEASRYAEAIRELPAIAMPPLEPYAAPHETEHF
jgi:hypothetical protein